MHFVSTGADNIRKYWSRYYQGSQGVIFVLDSASSEDDLETARNELHSALQHPQLCTLPFLILANHQDKPAARSVQEVCTTLKCRKSVHCRTMAAAVKSRKTVDL
jgi:signal recognition particle receptor subunit beta